MTRKGSIKAGTDSASPISGFKTSVVDLTNTGKFDDCLKALEQAEDDSQRATMMS